ncbi:MAG: hypothetical protein E7391_09130 [Ruminococcaceae bacterium]|nr:hypothetical protein [Oscillospiraceae bacterium]
MARKKPKKLITLDTETYNGLKGDLKRIAIYDGYDVTYGYTFPDVEKKINEWIKKGYAIEIFIHNAEFDLRKIPQIFEKGNVKWGSTKTINGKFVILSCLKYTIHDSLKLIPMSLKKACEDFDIENGKLDLWEEVQKVYPNQYSDAVDFLDRCDVDDELFLKYLGYDVISLYELIEKLCDVSGLDFETLCKCMTTASMSKKIFKYGFKGVPFKSEGMEKTDFQMLTKNKFWNSYKEIKHNFAPYSISYVDIENMIRETYTGGRTEVFKPYLNKSEEVVGFHMDINSLYPYQMLTKEYPIGTPHFYTDEFQTKYYWENWLFHHKGLGFISADLYIPETHIPPLPFKTGKLIFPCGYVSGSFTFNELEHAVKHYDVKILKIHHLIYFKETFKVFKNFISVLYDIKENSKKQGNLALYTLSKLLMNTGYGWTGMRKDDKTELQPIEKIKNYEPEQIKFIDEELGYIEVKSVVKSETIQVQIASYVTSYARLELLKAFEILQEHDAEIYYCDTDSIVSNKLLPVEMLDEYKIGLWDLEQELHEGIFIQPKVYYEHTTKKQNIKFKGVTRDTQKTFNRDFIIDLYNKLAQGKEDKFLLESNVDVFRSINYLLKKGKDLNEFETRDKYLYLKNKQKRIINYTENFTKPYYFKSLKEFYNFDLTPDLEPFKDEKGNLFNAVL